MPNILYMRTSKASEEIQRLKSRLIQVNPAGYYGFQEEALIKNYGLIVCPCGAPVYIKQKGK